MIRVPATRESLGPSPRDMVVGDPADPEITERFEVLALAGSGGMGRVYRARDRATNQIVALKVLRSEDGDVRRFAREATVLAALDHPGVVRYLGNGATSNGAHYLAMEWLAGIDLGQSLGRATMPVHDAITIARAIAEALGAAHRAGIVHRDLKPANVFLVDGDLRQPKLIDFGVACVASEITFTQPGAVIGTPAYMAPEQVRGERVDSRADLYALGALLFRMLAGRAPIEGDHHIAVLAKVLVDPAPSVLQFCPEAPPDLARLVSRLLAKDREARPPTAERVADELAEIATSAPSVRRDASAISSREQRVACVVLCGVGGRSEETTLVGRAAETVGDEARRAVEAHGGVLANVAHGVWLITVPGTSSPSEEATRAARCALAVSAMNPARPVVIATGRVVVATEMQIGEVIDRAASRLLDEESDSARTGVWLDEATASLLDDRFEVHGESAWRSLLGERNTLTPRRTLLGRPTPCVGRARELAALSAAIDACSDESTASAVLIVGPPGLGKSRLVQEMLASTSARRNDVQVLVARGDAMQADAPYTMVAQLVRRSMGLSPDARGVAPGPIFREAVRTRFSGVEAERIEGALGEMCGIHAPREVNTVPVRARRTDAGSWADAMRDAWVDWLRAFGDDGTVLIVLEDLHWADYPSVRLIDATLGALAERRVIVVATARPEVHARFGALWERRTLQTIQLGPLARAAAERLVRDALGDAVSGSTVGALLDRAAGHPFHLEELVRAFAAGQGPAALPDSVLGMVQARLDVLRAPLRRALRAASVFGETFWRGGVEALLHDGGEPDDVRSLLARLVDEEIVSPRSVSRIAGEQEFAFRHALVRDGAYAMLTERDRVLAHRLAGGWLEAHGADEPAALAMHFDAGESPARAAVFYHRAATQALDASDLDRAANYAERALACGPDAPSEGALWAIQAEVAYWRGALDVATDRASAAADRLDAGTEDWFGSVSAAIGAHGQRGDNDGVARWLGRAAAVDARDDARGAQAVTLCRGMTQLFWAHDPRERVDALERVERVVRAGDLAPDEMAWVHRVRAESAWLHGWNVDRCFDEFAAACTAFETAHARRNLSLTQLNWASLAGWSGDTDRGLDLVARAHREATRMGWGFLVAYGQCVRGLIEAYAGMDCAERTMRDSLSNLAASPRLSFIARMVTGRLALARGDLDAADVDARAAVATQVVDDLRPAGFALRSSVRLAQGALDEALDDARCAAELRAPREDLELTEGIAELSLAESLSARGDKREAARAITVAHTRLMNVAKTIASPERRAHFLTRRLSNDRIVAMMRELVGTNERA